ncbi:hypothetical protein BH11MYX3_BH11MYX3_22040 [soil metagenome]
MRLQLWISLLVACRTGPSVVAPTIEPANGHVATQPCPPPSAVFDNPKMFVFGGTRANQAAVGELVTLSNGDAVIGMGSGIAWWSGGTCHWTARVEWGRLAAVGDRVLAHAGPDHRNGNQPTIWSEIDASGRIVRTLSIPSELASAASAGDDIYIAVATYARPTKIWRFDASGGRTLFATVNLPEGLWHYSMLARSGEIAVLASAASESSLDPERYDPRLIVFSQLGIPWFEARLGKGAFVTNALAFAPGGYVATLQPSYGPSLVVHIAGNGRIVDASSASPPTRMPGWTAGTVDQNGQIIAGHEIAVETWVEDSCPEGACARTAQAAYVLPP